MATAELHRIGVGIHSVLIATDFSRYSKVAENIGLALAHEYQAKAHMVFVLPRDEFLMAGPDAYVAAQEAAARDLQELKAELQRRHSYTEGKEYHLVMLEGDVAQSILECARDREVDLIIVGTHGRGGLGKMLMGSVAEHVFRQSPVPVITVGPHLRQPRKGLARNMLVAADFTPAAERAAQYAAALAREHNAKLTLLHVVEPAELKGIADRAEVLHGIKNKLRAMLGRHGEGLTPCYRVEVGSLIPTILRTEIEIAADLLVLGVRPWSGLRDRLMWPNAYAIVRAAECPVLTVRGRNLHQE